MTAGLLPHPFRCNPTFVQPVSANYIHDLSPPSPYFFYRTWLQDSLGSIERKLFKIVRLPTTTTTTTRNLITFLFNSKTGFFRKYHTHPSLNFQIKFPSQKHWNWTETKTKLIQARIARLVCWTQQGSSHTHPIVSQLFSSNRKRARKFHRARFEEDSVYSAWQKPWTDLVTCLPPSPRFDART